MIASNFLHAYVLVQVENPCTENTTYKVQTRPVLVVTLNNGIRFLKRSSGPRQPGTGQETSCAYRSVCTGTTKFSGITHHLRSQHALKLLFRLCFLLETRARLKYTLWHTQVWLLFALCQQVSVAAREDVPPFGPPLPNPAVFRKVRDGAGSYIRALSCESSWLGKFRELFEVEWLKSAPPALWLD